MHCQRATSTIAFVTSRKEPNAWERANGPLNGAKSMPAKFYTSPAVYEVEREHIFGQYWFFVCRAEMVADPGDFRAVETAGGPVIVMRGVDGKLRAFANVCRHRGALLLRGTGTGNRIVCPYHAWSYNSDGTLATCPDMQGVDGFDPDDNGLAALRLETWSGFVFLNYRTDGPSLLEHLGDLPARMATHRMDEMRCTWTKTYYPKCNWKLILENSLETYHTGILHKNTVGRQTSRTLHTSGNWRGIQVLSGRSVATLPGVVPPFPVMSGLDADALLGTYFTVIQPTVQFAIAQDCMWWLNVTPVGHDRSILEVGGCFPRAAIDDPEFESKAAAYYERWDAVALEDFGVLEQQQLALGSLLHRPGSLSWRDDEVQAFGKWVCERLPELPV